MKIYVDKYYVLRDHPGIAGYRRWYNWEWRVVTGRVAKIRTYLVLGELFPMYDDLYRCEDGHAPESQPRLMCKEALKWLKTHVWNSIVLLDPETLSVGMKPLIKEIQKK